MTFDWSTTKRLASIRWLMVTLVWLTVLLTMAYLFHLTDDLSLQAMTSSHLYMFWRRFGRFERSGKISRNITLGTNEALPMKTILLWNSWFKFTDFGAGGLGQTSFIENGCVVRACNLTRDHNLLSKADAVIIHARSRVPPLKFRPRGQRYVFFLRESPSHTGNTLKHLVGAFNWTMTYRRDSDIPIEISITKPLAIAGDHLTKYRLQFPLAQRTRSIAWVVSHCKTSNKRELYVRELRKHIDVDIFGKCGNTTFCPPSTPSCFKTTLPSRYKFYLGFENSVCKDYVTEKTFRTLNTEIIPIVYGGTNYTRDTPPHSVINIMDFESPRKLADYLKWLGNNETEYLKYFNWKGRYGFQGRLRPGFCRLCEKLHRDNTTKTYKNVLEWWSNEACSNNVNNWLDSKVASKSAGP